MFAGNIGEAQDFSAILDAAEQLKIHNHIRWLIVGDGRMANWVRNEVTRRGLQDVFLMFGRYSIDRMPSMYQHADALLVTLKPEPIFAMTLPGKVQSYLNSGIPIIGMLDGEGAEVINAAKVGFSNMAGDSAALAHAILRMSQLTAAQRHIMGEQGRAYGKQEFDRSMLVSKLENWLMSLSTSKGFPHN
jgi:glycosyltransferase involved in cell wall biosynthesis